MHHPALALVTRDLRLTLRGRTLPMVLIACSALLFIGALLMIANVRAAAAGRTFLLAAANLQVVLITVIAAVLVAGSVSEEKETGGLDLLLMTGMTPFSLLAGIAGGRVVALLATLLVQVPFLVMGVTAGGVLPGQVAAAFAVLASHAVFCTGLAVWTSLLTASHGRAAAWMAGVVATITLVGYSLGSPGITPFGALAGVFANPVAFAFTTVWCAVYAGAGLGCFGLACLTFERALAGAGAPRTETARPPRRARPGLKNGMYWKDYHFLYGGADGITLRVALFLAGVLLAGAGAILRGAWGDSLLTFSAGAGLAVSTSMLAFELLYQSARMFRSDVLEGAQDTLRLLPGRPRALVGQKQRALLHIIAPLLLAWLICLCLATPLPLYLTLVLAFLMILIAYSFHVGVADLSLETGWWSIPLGLVRVGGIWFAFFGLLAIIAGAGGGIVLLAGLILFILLFNALEVNGISHLVLNYLASDPSERTPMKPWRRVLMLLGDASSRPGRVTRTVRYVRRRGPPPPPTATPVPEPVVARAPAVSPWAGVGRTLGTRILVVTLSMTVVAFVRSRGIAEALRLTGAALFLAETLLRGVTYHLVRPRGGPYDRATARAALRRSDLQLAAALAPYVVGWVLGMSVHRSEFIWLEWIAGGLVAALALIFHLMTASLALCIGLLSLPVSLLAAAALVATGRIMMAFVWLPGLPAVALLAFLLYGGRLRENILYKLSEPPAIRHSPMAVLAALGHVLTLTPNRRKRS